MGESSGSWPYDRNGREWRDAVISYLEFRAGAAWRRTVPRRDEPQFLEYFHALRLVQMQGYAEMPPCNCAAYCLPAFGFRAAPKPGPDEREPESRRVAWIARPDIHQAGCRCVHHRPRKTKSEAIQ